MEASAIGTPAALDERRLRLVEGKLSQTLDMLDHYGVSGVLAVCLLPDGASYLTSGGGCTDVHGAAMALFAGLTAIRDVAEKRREPELVAMLNEAVRALAPAVGKVGAHRDSH